MIIGAKKHGVRIKRMSSPETIARVGKALFKAGQVIQNEAQISITRGAVSGKGHVRSKPGEPPKADTHFLADNIETTQPAPLRVEVSSNAPYALALEVGTSKMAARPYMKPAVAKKKDEVTAYIRGVIQRAQGG